MKADEKPYKVTR